MSEDNLQMAGSGLVAIREDLNYPSRLRRRPAVVGDAAVKNGLRR